MDKREISTKYKEVAEDLINTEPKLSHIKDSEVKIVYLSSEHCKKEGNKYVAGQCEKIPEKYKWAIPSDFSITVFEPNVERFTEEQIKILLFHELLHIGIDIDGNEEKYYIVNHDVEDFKEILNRFGMDWSEIE